MATSYNIQNYIKLKHITEIANRVHNKFVIYIKLIKKSNTFRLKKSLKGYKV